MAATIQESVNRCGWFTPVESHLLTVPEYLVLIDRRGVHDQAARLADGILDQFEEEGVFIERFYFDEDPRILFPYFAEGRTASLGKLVSNHPHHCLWIFSDGESLINPVTGRLQP